MPSGNLTMQQMVARQVDLGTYAGQSFIIGNDKGGLIAIAMIEHVGKTARIMTRKDLNITKVEQLRGKKVANQTGSSIGNVFVDTDRCRSRTEQGRLPGSPHEREQHGGRAGRQDRRCHGQCRALQRHRRRGRHRHRPDGFFRCRSDAGIHGGDAGIRRSKNPTPWWPISRPGSMLPRISRTSPRKSPTSSIRSTPPRATPCRPILSPRRCPASRSIPAFPATSSPTCRSRRKSCCRIRRSAAIPDWNTALRPDFMEARARSDGVNNKAGATAPH